MTSKSTSSNGSGELVRPGRNTLAYATKMRDAWVLCVMFGTKCPVGTKMQWEKQPGHKVEVTLRTVPTVVGDGSVVVSIEEERCMVSVKELSL